MLDIRDIRSNPEEYIQLLGFRGISRSEVESILDIDSRAKEKLREVETLRSEIKSISKEVAKASRENKEDEVRELKEKSRVLGESSKDVESEFNSFSKQLNDELLNLPNIPSSECPVGKSEADNLILNVNEPMKNFEHFQCVPHWEIGKELGILDLERGAKLSGSMFPMFRKAGSKLLRALTSFALDRHSDLFEEVRPPTLVKSDTLRSTGHLPKFSDEAYHIERDDLWAIPTAEVPLTSLFRDEILKESDLPKRFTAVTACFRREAGAAGRDTRGLLRVHEFDKVEILACTTKEQAPDIHLELLGRAESLVVELGLNYRVLDLCTMDLGQSSRRTFDIEVYSPGTQKWLEVSSVSWFGDYQARRANLRYRPNDGSPIQFLHTLNGSALAWPRIFAALIEVYHQENGTIVLPDVLSSYLNGKRVIDLDGNLQF